MYIQSSRQRRRKGPAIWEDVEAAADQDEKVNFAKWLKMEREGKKLSAR